MAGALRPVVGLMALVSLLFVADGVLDGVYPGGTAWSATAYHGLGWLPYVFAVLNFLAMVMVIRGSEGGLVGRIGLSGFFLVERPLTALLLGPKPPEAVAVHAATAVVELIILLGGLRVWRLGRSFGDAELTALLDVDAAAAPPGAVTESAEPTPITARSSIAVAVFALLLTGVLLADGAYAGYLPGGRVWGVTQDSSGWLVYVFAVVVLTIAARAVHGGALPLRLLFSIALALFLERAFSPFVQPVTSGVALGLHAFAAFVALALALVAASALRRTPTLAPARA